MKSPFFLVSVIAMRHLEFGVWHLEMDSFSKCTPLRLPLAHVASPSCHLRCVASCSTPTDDTPTRPFCLPVCLPACHATTEVCMCIKPSDHRASHTNQPERCMSIYILRCMYGQKYTCMYTKICMHICIYTKVFMYTESCVRAQQIECVAVGQTDTKNKCCLTLSLAARK